jgi:hypothetical protein
MSEYRKAFEYEEDKGVGGFLMLFFVMLLSTELLLAAAILVQGNAVLRDERYLRPVFLALGIGYAAFVLVVCVGLRRMWPNAVLLSRIFLIARALFLTPAYLLLYRTFSRIPGIRSGFRTETDMALVTLLVPLAYILGFSVLWYVYLSRSRRARQLAQTASERRGAHAGPR